MAQAASVETGLFFIDTSGGTDSVPKKHLTEEGEKGKSLKLKDSKEKKTKKRIRQDKVPHYEAASITANAKENDTELERLVFGDDFSSPSNANMDETEKKEISKSESESEDELSQSDEEIGSLLHAKKRRPVWEDDDDKELSFNLQENKKLRKLRKTEEEKEVSGTKFEQRLRSQFEKLVGNPTWAEIKEGEKDGMEEDLHVTAGDFLGKSDRLPSSIISMEQLRDVNSSKKYPRAMSSVEFHPNANIILTAGLCQAFDLFQITKRSCEKIQTIFLEKFPVSCAHFSLNGEEIVLTSKKKEYYTYNMVGGAISAVHGIRGHPEKTLDMFVVAPDSSCIAFRGHNGYIHLVSAKSKEWIHSFKMNTEVKNISFFPDSSKMLSSGGGGEVYVWDVKSKRCLHKFQDDGCIKATSLAISPNGQFFACGSSSGVVNIYDDECLRNNVPNPIKTVLNLKTEVDNLLFNPTSEILALASSAAKDAIKLLHTPTMTVFQNWPNLKSRIGRPVCFDFSSQGGYLSVGNAKGFAQLYRLHHFPKY